MASVIVLDQAAKWWGWRHVPGVVINSGGDVITGPTIGRWYTDPLTGAVLDLLGFALLVAAVLLLARRQHPAVVVPGTLMIAGWGSNLLDRLGMHYLTAPGSYRGVVDFICIDAAHYNVADLFIIGATPLFVLGMGWRAADRLAGIKARTPAIIRASASATRHRPRTRTWLAALASVVLVVLAVTVGATNYGEASMAPAHMSAAADQHGDRS
jgi:lipoprotein signal peptidase